MDIAERVIMIMVGITAILSAVCAVLIWVAKSFIDFNVMKKSLDATEKGVEKINEKIDQYVTKSEMTTHLDNIHVRINRIDRDIDQIRNKI